jgi:hypothetical protein
MSTSSFIGRAQHASWDSGRVGYIYVSKEAVKKEWKVKRISPKLAQTIEKNLDGEVETYDSYLRGDVYGFKVSTIPTEEGFEDEGEELDACWGFIGDYNGYVLEEAKRSADYHAEGGDLSDYSDDEVNDLIFRELKPKTIRCTACEIDFTDEKDLIVNSIVDDFTGTVEYDEVCPHCNTGEYLIDLPKGAI